MITSDPCTGYYCIDRSNMYNAGPIDIPPTVRSLTVINPALSDMRAIGELTEITTLCLTDIQPKGMNADDIFDYLPASVVNLALLEVQVEPRDYVGDDAIEWLNQNTLRQLGRCMPNLRNLAVDGLFVNDFDFCIRNGLSRIHTINHSHAEITEHLQWIKNSFKFLENLVVYNVDIPLNVRTCPYVVHQPQCYTDDAGVFKHLKVIPWRNRTVSNDIPDPIVIYIQ